MTLPTHETTKSKTPGDPSPVGREVTCDDTTSSNANNFEYHRDMRGLFVGTGPAARNAATRLQSLLELAAARRQYHPKLLRAGSPRTGFPQFHRRLAIADSDFESISR